MTREELISDAKLARQAGDKELELAVLKKLDELPNDEPSMSMPKNSMAKVFGRSIADLGSGVIKSGGDIARGIQQILSIKDEESLKKEQEMANTEYAPVAERSPFLSAMGQSVPAMPFGGGLVSVAAKTGLLEASKYGSLSDRLQKGGSATAYTLAIPGALSTIGKAAKIINKPFKSSSDENLKRMISYANKHNIPIDNSQLTGNKSLQALDSLMNDLPFTSTAQAEKQAAQREAWQRAIFTKGGENTPWQYNTRNPAEAITKYGRSKNIPEATYNGKTNFLNNDANTDLSVYGKNTDVSETGFMEQYAKAIDALKGKELTVPSSLAKYNQEPEFIGGYAKGTSKRDDLDIYDGVFREVNDLPSSNKIPGFTTHSMPASEAVNPTQEVMNNMKYRLNTLYNDVHSNNSLLIDKSLHNSLARIKRDYQNSELPSDLRKIVFSKIDDIQRVQPGTKVPGRIYQNIRSRLDDNMSTYKNDSTAYNALLKIRNTLDNKMESGLSETDKLKLDAANKGWMTMKTIEASIDNNQGVIDEKKFFNNLLKQDKTKSRTIYGKGDQELTEIAKAGSHFIRPKRDSVSSFAKYPWLKTLGGLTAVGGGAALAPIATATALGATGLGALGTKKLQQMMWTPKSYLSEGLGIKNYPKTKKILNGVKDASKTGSYIGYLMSQEEE